MKKAETDFTRQAQHPKWRLLRPQHSQCGRRDPRDRDSHALLPRDWLCGRCARDPLPEGLGAPSPSGLQSRRGRGRVPAVGVGVVTRDTSRHLSHLLGAHPGFSGLALGARMLATEAACSPTPRPGHCSGLFRPLKKPAPVVPFKDPTLLPELRSRPSLDRACSGDFSPESRFISSKREWPNRFRTSPAVHSCLSHPLPSSGSRPSSRHLRPLILPSRLPFSQSLTLCII